MCNAALIGLGAKPIMALNENNDAAAACNWRYEAVRNATLRRHNWSCAKKRQILARDSDAPAFKWTYSYTLPGDCLRVRDVFGNDGITQVGYEVVGKFIHTDSAYVYLEYTAKITDPTVLDSLCLECMAAFLAAELADYLTGSSTERERQTKIAYVKLQEAILVDAQTSGRRASVAVDTWVGAR